MTDFMFDCTDPEIVSRILSIAPEKSSVFPYGSRVYGTHMSHSDHDFIIVCDERDIKGIARERINSRTTELHVYETEDFQDMLDRHEISAIECWSLPPKLKFKNNVNLKFKLNLQTLRSSVSEKSNHSWVKAKKKLIVPEDRAPYIAKKSMFHSMRILMFGTQIARAGRIMDYTVANCLYDRIMSSPDDWECLDALFRPEMQALATEFRKFAPK